MEGWNQLDLPSEQRINCIQPVLDVLTLEWGLENVASLGITGHNPTERIPILRLIGKGRGKGRGHLLRKSIGKGPFCFRVINDLGIGEVYDIPLHWILFITEEENVRTPDDLGRIHNVKVPRSKVKFKGGRTIHRFLQTPLRSSQTCR